MADPDDPPSPIPPDEPKAKRKRVKKHAIKLTGREYLPFLFTMAFWGLTALSTGTADTARLLSVTLLNRALCVFVYMSTLTAVRKRWHQDAPVRRQALRAAALIQTGSVLALALLLFPIDQFLRHHGQELVATMLPLVALGVPARFYRSVDLRTYSQLFRLSSTASGLLGACVAYLLDAGPIGYALAFGLREWVAALVTGLVQRDVKRARRPSDAPLTLAEVARDTVVVSRRRLTYRLTKNLLAILGPVGNAAARTGRGLNWHSRLEPYLPHRQGGFVLFALLTGGIAVFLLVRSGEPLAMIGAAGAMQLCAIALNVLLWWRFLPDRDDPTLVVEDDDDD